MPVSYEPWLVLLSIVMAVQGAYVGLSLAVQVADATGLRRRLLLAGAAFSLAIAIWTMHFVGMLAAELPFPVDYLVFPTLLSFLVCVIVVGAAVYATSSGPVTASRLAFAAILMGLGIVSMHYIGMNALHASAHMIHAAGYVAASMVIAIAAAGLALWLAASRGDHPPLLLSAIAFGIAVSGMHYTAMQGMAVFPHAAAASDAPALSRDLLAIVVAVVAFCVSGIFLLFLVPDRSRPATGERASTLDASALSPLPQPAGVPVHLASEVIDMRREGDRPHTGFAPLGGAGTPPQRPARHLPIERDGTSRSIPVDQIVAVHANAHYTYVFNGTEKLFCPLAIGDVDGRLDKLRFLRVHRSHIINVDHVVGHRRSGDNEFVELAANEQYLVPVSRSRVGWLKARIANRPG